MAKAGPILETILGGTRRESIAMSKDRRSEVAAAGRDARRVSVFGRGVPVLRRTAQTEEDLRSSMLPVLRSPDELWAGLPSLRLDPDHAAAMHLIQTHHEDPVGLLYDRLRTRLLQVLQERGWSRVGVTAPLRGCGASTVAANLALALARRPSGRTVLMDMDLRQPAQAGIFGLTQAGALREVLTGMQPVESHFGRIGRTLALGLNQRAENDAAELLQEPGTVASIDLLLEDFSPDVALFDLPPLLETDDVQAFLPQLDGLLLVIDGTRNTAAQVRDCERLLKDQTEIIGVVLNRAEDSPARRRWWGG